MKRRNIIILAVITVILITGVVFGLVIINKVKKFDIYMAEVEIHEVDLNTVKDGTYAAATDAGPIVVELSVTVRDHQITEINLLKHLNGRGEAAFAIIEDIIEQQSLLVDSISGATLSSTVILDTVESALKQ
ncbi:MAG: FMN-binding protein [Spirochaetia bacterium]|jgi:uncharacterized protein with FMN-binding domain|nr:FMN-binding protein [Spirochaetia bacterium]